jgi:hypothetical protein
MSTFTQHGSFPACLVKPELLADLENYIRQRATDIAGRSNETVHYDVKVSENRSVEELGSVAQLPSYLPPDTKSISLEANVFGGLPTKVSLRVTFTTGFLSSGYYIRLETDSAREAGKGIASEIERRINQYHFDEFVKPHTINSFVGAWAFAVVLFFAAFVAYFDQSTPISIKARLVLGAVFAEFLVIGYFAIRFRTPYCVFQTTQNDRLLDGNRRLAWGLLLFGLTGIIGWVLSFLAR